MTHEAEIKDLKHNIKTVRKALTFLSLIQPLVKDQAATLYTELKESKMMTGLLNRSEEVDDTIERTSYEYIHAIDYFESRIRTLQGLDRVARFGVIPKRTLEDSPTGTPSRKPQESPKSRHLKVRFELLPSPDRYRVILGEEPVGIIRRTKVKYVSGTAKVFTKEALETRKFVKDGMLQTEDKELFSTTKYKTWVIDRQPHQSFKSFEDAATELIAQRYQGVKIQL